MSDNALAIQYLTNKYTNESENRTLSKEQIEQVRSEAIDQVTIPAIRKLLKDEELNQQAPNIVAALRDTLESERIQLLGRYSPFVIKIMHAETDEEESDNAMLEDMQDEDTDNALLSYPEIDRSNNFARGVTALWDHSEILFDVYSEQKGYRYENILGSTSAQQEKIKTDYETDPKLVLNWEIYKEFRKAFLEANDQDERIGRLLDRAIVFTSKQHAAADNAIRDDLRAYIVHPIEVAYHLVQSGITDKMAVLIALFHDLFEDTTATPEQIFEALNTDDQGETDELINRGEFELIMKVVDEKMTKDGSFKNDNEKVYRHTNSNGDIVKYHGKVAANIKQLDNISEGLDHLSPEQALQHLNSMRPAEALTFIWAVNLKIIDRIHNLKTTESEHNTIKQHRMEQTEIDRWKMFLGIPIIMKELKKEIRELLRREEKRINAELRQDIWQDIAQLASDISDIDVAMLTKEELHQLEPGERIQILYHPEGALDEAGQEKWSEVGSFVREDGLFLTINIDGKKNKFFLGDANTKYNRFIICARHKSDEDPEKYLVIIKKFGALIRTRRESQNMDRGELAKKLSISPGYMGNIERGDMIPSEELTKKISTQLDIREEELLTLREEALEADEERRRLIRERFMANRLGQVDQGDNAQLGGINLDPTLFDLQIKRDGNGVPLPISQQPIENMKIDGFFPVIINVSPINMQLLLGLGSENPDQQEEGPSSTKHQKLSYVATKRKKFF